MIHYYKKGTIHHSSLISKLEQAFYVTIRIRFIHRQFDTMIIITYYADARFALHISELANI